MEGNNLHNGYRQHQSVYDQHMYQQKQKIQWTEKSWLEKNGKRIIISIIVVLILYYWGCVIPIINIICPVFEFLGKIIGGVGGVFGFANNGLDVIGL
jgi:hypothetical protein